MIFADTHSNPDTERDMLTPDVTGSHKEDVPEKYPPEFPTFVELKKLENADPFCDPGAHSPYLPVSV